jgi:hypothetical protein
MTPTTLFRIGLALGLSLGLLNAGVWWPALACLIAWMGAFLFGLRRVTAGAVR